MGDVEMPLPEAAGEPEKPAGDKVDFTADDEVDFTADDAADGSWGLDEAVAVETVEQEVKKEVEEEKKDDPSEPEKPKSEEPEVSYDCELCKATFKGQTQELHEKLPKHQKMLSRLKKYGTTEVTPEMHTFHCYICGTISNSPDQLQIHKRGTKHKTRCQNLNIDPELTKAPAIVVGKGAGTATLLGESLSCNVCKVTASSIQQLNQHLSGKKHKDRIRQLHGGGGQGSQDASKKEPPGQQQHARNDGTAASHAFQSGAPKPKSITQAGKQASKRVHDADVGPEVLAAKKRAPGVQPDAANDAVKAVMPFYCDTCSIYLNSSFQLNEHIKGKVHLDRLKQNEQRAGGLKTAQADGSGAPGADVKKPAKKQTQPMACKVCKLTLNSPQQYTQHITSKKHQMRAAGGDGRRPSPRFLGQRGNAPFRKNFGAFQPRGRGLGPRGPSVGFRPRAPSMTAGPQASSMAAMGPRPRVPNATVIPRAPGTSMRLHRPGMNARPQGPGMATAMRPRVSRMEQRSEGLSDFEPSHQFSSSRRAFSHATRQDYVDAAVTSQGYDDGGYEDSSYDQAYDRKERSYRQSDDRDYGGVDYLEPSYGEHEYGDRGYAKAEPDETFGGRNADDEGYGPATFRGLHQELYSEDSEGFASASRSSKIETYGERRRDVERDEPMFARYGGRPLTEHYDERPPIGHYDERSPMAREGTWEPCVSRLRRPLVDF